MNIELQNWMLVGVSGILITLLWWSVKGWITKIDKKFDRLIDAVQEQSLNHMKQAGEIDNLTKRVDTTDTRLNDHAKRINQIEIKVK